jgi:hypothetical protein
MMSKIKRFLQIIAGLHIVGGVLLPFLAELAIFNFYYQHLPDAFNSEILGLGPGTKFLVGILGPTIASWGILFLYVVNTAFANPNRRSWWFIVMACLVWAPYDSVLSIYYGVYLNALLNFIVFVAIMIPMLIVRPKFIIDRYRG